MNISDITSKLNQNKSEILTQMQLLIQKSESNLKEEITRIVQKSENQVKTILQAELKQEMHEIKQQQQTLLDFLYNLKQSNNINANVTEIVQNRDGIMESEVLQDEDLFNKDFPDIQNIDYSKQSQLLKQSGKIDTNSLLIKQNVQDQDLQSFEDIYEEPKTKQQPIYKNPELSLTPVDQFDINSEKSIEFQEDEKQVKFDLQSVQINTKLDPDQFKDQQNVPKDVELDNSSNPQQIQNPNEKAKENQNNQQQIKEEEKGMKIKEEEKSIEIKEEGKGMALNLEGIELNDDSKIKMTTSRRFDINQIPELKKIIEEAQKENPNQSEEINSIDFSLEESKEKMDSAQDMFKSLESSLFKISQHKNKENLKNLDSSQALLQWDDSSKDLGNEQSENNQENDGKHKSNKKVNNNLMDTQDMFKWDDESKQNISQDNSNDKKLQQKAQQYDQISQLLKQLGSNQSNAQIVNENEQMNNNLLAELSNLVQDIGVKSNSNYAVQNMLQSLANLQDKKGEKDDSVLNFLEKDLSDCLNDIVNNSNIQKHENIQKPQLQPSIPYYSGQNNNQLLKQKEKQLQKLSYVLSGLAKPKNQYSPFNSVPPSKHSEFQFFRQQSLVQEEQKQEAQLSMALIDKNLTFQCPIGSPQAINFTIQNNGAIDWNQQTVLKQTKGEDFGFIEQPNLNLKVGQKFTYVNQGFFAQQGTFDIVFEVSTVINQRMIRIGNPIQVKIKVILKDIPKHQQDNYLKSAINEHQQEMVNKLVEILGISKKKARNLIKQKPKASLEQIINEQLLM